MYANLVTLGSVVFFYFSRGTYSLQTAATAIFVLHLV